MCAPSFRTERALLAVGLALAGCSKAPPEPNAGRDGGVLAKAPPADAGLVAEAGPRLEDGGVARVPDWDLDKADPARDYVTRYVRATKRYGDETACISVEPSVTRDTGGARTVEVGEDPSKCPGSAKMVRDVFVVDVGRDRLAVDDPAKRAALRNWPDGSDPGEPPKEVDPWNRMREWTSPLHKAFNDLGLSPFRVELYGRGTYPVVALAGWRAPVTRLGSPDKLRPTMKKLCATNEGGPFAMFGGTNRVELLRVRCPSGDTRWENLD